MDVALQKRRLYIALGATAVALIVAAIAIAASFAFHAAWKANDAAMAIAATINATAVAPRAM